MWSWQSPKYWSELQGLTGMKQAEKGWGASQAWEGPQEATRKGTNLSKEPRSGASAEHSIEKAKRPMFKRKLGVETDSNSCKFSGSFYTGNLCTVKAFISDFATLSTAIELAR